MEATVKQANKITDMKARMSDIYLAVSWREIARTYFDKSVPWFQHKMYGIDGNGGKGGFTEDEAGQLKGALLDLSNRIRHSSPGHCIAVLNKSRRRAGGATILVLR